MKRRRFLSFITCRRELLSALRRMWLAALAHRGVTTLRPLLLAARRRERSRLRLSMRSRHTQMRCREGPASRMMSCRISVTITSILHQPRTGRLRVMCDPSLLISNRRSRTFLGIRLTCHSLCQTSSGQNKRHQSRALSKPATTQT